MTNKKEDKDMFYVRTTKTFKKIFRQELLAYGYKGFSDFFNDCIRKFMNKNKEKNKEK